MNRERLQRVADFLRTIPPEYFHLGEWWEESTCGSVGCVAGHMCHSKQFQAEGWKYDGCPRLDTGFSELFAWDALEDYFGLQGERVPTLIPHLLFGASATRWLFRDDHYPANATPDQVADRIEEYIKCSPLSSSPVSVPPVPTTGPCEKPPSAS